MLGKRKVPATILNWLILSDGSTTYFPYFLNQFMTNFDAVLKEAPILHAAQKATPGEAIKNQEGVVKFIYSKFYFYIEIKFYF